MKNQYSVTPTGAVLKTSEFHQTLGMLVAAMKADFPTAYAKAYGEEEVLKTMKRRLMHILDGFSSIEIVAGYDTAVEEANGYMPDLPSIARAASKERHILKRQREDDDKTKEIEASHTPQYTVNPLQILSQASESARKVQAKDSPVDRMKRREEMLASHQKLLETHENRALIKTQRADGEHRCGYPACFYAGIRSSSVNGSSRWYCEKHFRN